MSNEPGSRLEPPESERTGKPLLIECDYNTNRRTLTFYSAQECSCDELRAKIKERFNLVRPFKIQWEDEDGEKNWIQDDVALDEAIEYHSTDGVSVTMLVKISPEYDRSSPPLSGRGDSAEVPFALGEFSVPQQGGDAVAPSSKNEGKSTRNSLPWKSTRSHILNSDSRASSTDEAASGKSVINGSTGGRRSYNPTGSVHRDDPQAAVFEFLKRQEQRSHENSSFVIARQKEWVQSVAPPQLMFDAMDAESLSGSLSLSGSSLSDGPPDPGNPPERSERRDNYTGTGYSESAGDSEYGVQSHFSMVVSQGVTCCSECDCILEGIKYVCTTCGEKTPTPRSTIIAAAAEGKGKDRESSTGNSPTRTVLGRRFSGSTTSSTARVGYELCATCFENVGVDHSSASGINLNGLSRTTPTLQELAIARRSAPKQKGQLRHAFVEQFWYDNHWKDVEHEMSRHCSVCQSELPGDQYKCVICEPEMTICRACYSDVHNIHPIHPFLEMKVKPTSRSRSHSEVADSTILPPDDNPDSDEPALKHIGYLCSYCQRDIIGARYHCDLCEDIDICSDCNTAGLPGDLDAPDGGHRSSHDMLKISVPRRRSTGTYEVQNISQPTPGQRDSRDRAASTSVSSISRRYSVNTISYGDRDGAGTDTVEDFIHPQTCNSCEELIIGVRYQCLNCPSKPSSFNLCSDCEVKSYKVHDPMHTFLKLPRLVDIPGPLESEFPFIPILYRYPAGPAPSSPSGNTPGDPAGYLHNLTHGSTVRCDRHLGRIVGKWYHCAFCPRDLCTDCEELETHDSTHAFLVLKALVDIQAFKQVFANPDRVPPVLHGNIYYPQHE